MLRYDRPKDPKRKVVAASLGGKMLSTDQLVIYREQAAQIAALPLTTMMREHLRTIACRKLFLESKNQDDLLAAKIMLWTLETEEQLLKDFKEMDVISPSVAKKSKQ